MFTEALEGRTAQARKLHFQLLPLFKAAFIETNPAPIKYAMQQHGLAAGSLRLPLVEIRTASRAVLDDILKDLVPPSG